MIDFFSSAYSSIRSLNAFLGIRFFSLLRVLVRNSANLILPPYILLSNKFKARKLGKPLQGTPQLIVSLTTYPARIGKVWIVIESIMRQTQKPDRIILWLSKEQFTDDFIIPTRLKDLQHRGLEIVFCEDDLRSHKKYYYVLKNYPDDLLLVIDDDVIYRSTLVSELLALHKEYPRAVCCDRTLHIETRDNEILPYKTWPEIKAGGVPSFELFHTSGQGSLYPPGAFYNAVLDRDAFMKYCKNADDIWLNCMAQLNNTPIVKLRRYVIWLPILYKINTTLHAGNLAGGQNDTQLNDVRKYCMELFGRDPFGWAKKR